MTTLKNTYLLRCAAVMTTALIMLLGGCRADDPLPGEDGYVPDGIKTAVFSLSIPSLSPVSRGDGVTDTSEGESYESFIDVHGDDYRFLFFDTDGKYIETLQVESIVMTSTDPADLVTTYLVEGMISDDLAHRSGVKVLALANWGDYEIPREVGVTTIQDICTSQNAVFDYNLRKDDKGLFPSVDHRIPMFGVTDPQTFRFDPETRRAEMDQIDLLRAYAKIEIVSQFTGYSSVSKCALKEVTLSRHNTAGCSAPSGINCASDYVNSTAIGGWNLTAPNAVHVVPGTQEDTPVSFVARPEEKNTYVLYVPEYINLTPDGLPSSHRAEMDLTFEVPDRNGTTLHTETEKLEFKYYSDLHGAVKEGDYFNLCRNVWYRYTVTKSPTRLIVDMQPYAPIELNPEFGLTRDKDGNILVRDANGVLIEIIPYDPTKFQASLANISIGDMSYVEVRFNDVVNFREFLDPKTGKPNGRRQDFLATGWNIYDKDGSMEYCFIYDDPEQPIPHTGTWMYFDNYDTMLERWENTREDADQTTLNKNVGKQNVKYETSPTDPDMIYISYLKDTKWEIEHSILTVYDVLNGKQDKSKILTIVRETGEVELKKEHKEMISDTEDGSAGERVEVVEVTQKINGVDILRYRFYSDGGYSVFSYSATDNKYDWDYYNPEGHRFSGFDHAHDGFGGVAVYSIYDRWGNLLSRSLEASENSNHTQGKHNANKMIVKNEPAPDGDGVIIYIRKAKAGTTNDYDFSKETNWIEAYRVKSNGDKEVLIQSDDI